MQAAAWAQICLPKRTKKTGLHMEHRVKSMIFQISFHNEFCSQEDRAKGFVAQAWLGFSRLGQHAQTYKKLDMRSKNILQIMGADLLSLTTLTALAEARLYDPSNAASPSGKTIGYELFRTIGCPLPPAPEPRKLIQKGVNFDNDKSTLRPDAVGILEQPGAFRAPCATS